MVQRERFFGALEKIEDMRSYRILQRSSETLDACVNSWDLVIWYNRLEAELDLLWELKLLEINSYARVKGTLEDYFKIFLKQLQKEEANTL
ncbi:MAG TPA: hypothetical protein IAC62_06455 [Candidatus Pelethocola excrementipullorum]|nr:hypothetical protein [Candidatus Pelethocola excrementipullorum]